MEFKRRPGGRVIGASAIQKHPVDRFIAAAVKYLTVEDGRLGAVTVAASSEVRRAMKRTLENHGEVRQVGQQPYPNEELRFVAEVYQSAPNRGKYKALEEAYRKNGHRFATGKAYGVKPNNYEANEKRKTAAANSNDDLRVEVADRAGRPESPAPLIGCAGI